MSKKKLIILVSSILTVAIIAGAAFFFFQYKDSDSDLADEEGTEQVAEEKEGNEEEKIKEEKRGNYPLDSFIVNLADPGGRRYLNIRIVLELDDKEFAESLKKQVPEIRDKILMILPTKTFKEIQSVEGKNSLRTIIIAELNNIIQEGKITNLYFQEFVVQ